MLFAVEFAIVWIIAAGLVLPQLYLQEGNFRNKCLVWSEQTSGKLSSIKKLVKYISALITAQSELSDCLKTDETDLFSVFNFAISTCFLSRHDGDSHLCHHVRWNSLSYKLHRMHDYLLSLKALALARDSGMNFCNILRFFTGEAIFSNHELGS